MKTKQILISLSVSVSLAMFCFSSCNKQNDWLDVKSSKSDVVPETLKDFQALLDDNNSMNSTTNAGLVGADNYSLTDIAYAASTEESRSLYTWNKVVWPNETSPQWDNSFKQIEFANVVLDGLKKINSSGYEYNNVKGEALFHRAFGYYTLAQLFCKPYSSSATSDAGLPLRTTSDVNFIAQRSSLSEAYDQILSDALEAAKLLPPIQTYLTRPTSAAAYALIAKTYLNMGDYINSELHATKTLEINSQLLDFNNNSVVQPTTPNRFLRFGKNNPEILFYTENTYYSVINASTSSRGVVSPELYNAYEANDLRKSVFFILSGLDAKYRGTYSGRLFPFCGIATNEVYLIRAECYARTNNENLALRDLNLLLKNRFRTGSYIDKIPTSPEATLQLILDERRKELPYTSNIRWEDLRRLNKETKFQKTLKRIVNGVMYTLTPNDSRYVLPIPNQEIRLTGLQQNER